MHGHSARCILPSVHAGDNAPKLSSRETDAAAAGTFRNFPAVSHAPSTTVWVVAGIEMPLKFGRRHFPDPNVSIAGGKVERNQSGAPTETAVQAALREANEEISLDLQPEELHECAFWSAGRGIQYFTAHLGRANAVAVRAAPVTPAECKASSSQRRVIASTGADRPSA